MLDFHKTNIFLKLLLASGFFLMFGFVSCARAYMIENFQEKVEDRFVISPVNLELALAPGESTTQKMMVVNRLGKTATFKIGKEDFTGSKDPEKASVLLGEESGGITSAKDWLAPEVDEIALNHGDRLTFSFEVSVPKDAIPGSHYAGILVSVTSEDSEAKDGSMVKLVSRVGMLTLINVSGETKESGKISEFVADKKFYRNGPVEFSAVFANTGNIYEKVKGEISIKNIWGSEVARVPVKEWVVLSDSVRRQKAEWNKKWLVGRYTARLTAFYGLGGNLTTVSDEMIFYAFPWHIALLLLLVFVIAYYVFKYFFSKFEIKRKE